MVLIQLTSTLPITPSSVKQIYWPKNVFSYLLQCVLFNSYIIFTKSNPNSHHSFLDYIADVSEILIQQKMYQHLHRLGSRKSQTEVPHQFHRNDPEK
jgi:hypothetical protein